MPFMHALQFVLDQERDPRETVPEALASGAGTGDAYNEYVAKHPSEHAAAANDGPRAMSDFNLGFWHDQWQRSGAGAMPRSLGLVHFDAAVNHGQGEARKMLAESGGDPSHYIDIRENFYHQIPNTTNTAAVGGYGEGGLEQNPGWTQKRIPALRAAIAPAIGRIAQVQRTDEE
jgi:hypothetical protein